MSIEVIEAAGLLLASVIVCAPTPQPASRTRLPAGYDVSECNNSTKVEAWSCRRRFSR